MHPAIARQAGIATRAQLRALGYSADAVRAQVDARRWRSLNEVVVCTHNGPLNRDQQRWAVILSAQGLAALGGLTALEMRNVADVVETASYAAIALVGAVLVLRKGAGLLAALRTSATPVKSPNGFFCESVDPLHRHSESCGCANVDPATLEGRFSLAGAAGIVVAAGLRPCSGAILVLAFTLAQGAFLAGAGAVLLMSAGTAITTGTLAGAAVFAKKAAKRWSALSESAGGLVFRGAEFLAAVLVLSLGLALLVGASCGGGA